MAGWPVSSLGLTSMDNNALEFSESIPTALEWRVRGPKQFFDSSKGGPKSRVTKSVKFGGGCVNNTMSDGVPTR